MNQLEHLIRFGDEDKAVEIITKEFMTLVQQVQDLTEKVKRRDALIAKIENEPCADYIYFEIQDFKNEEAKLD